MYHVGAVGTGLAATGVAFGWVAMAGFALLAAGVAVVRIVPKARKG